MSETSEGRPAVVSKLWVAVVVAFTLLELAFLFEACTAGLAGLERVFGIFTGLALVTFGIILYAGRLIFYD